MGATFKQEQINIRERLNALENHRHDALYEPKGLFLGKNIFINGDLRSQFVVNQRTFNGTWVDGDYGYDRWKGKTGGFIEQPIEEGNYEPETFYTLTYDDDVSIIVESPVSGTWNLTEDIPDTSEQIQLELGDKFTGFEIVPSSVNLINCQRYFLPLAIAYEYAEFGLFVAIATTLARSFSRITPMRVASPVINSGSVPFSKLGAIGGTVTAGSLVFSVQGDASLGELIIDVSGVSFGSGDTFIVRKDNDATILGLDAEL